ncbi:MAG TPA: glucosaminidase domain-containing protein [Symbiobacteriaceae bacterium]|nr:glucosaminidase domain-containing protein [Symbiobacteriaceae bacterium]
MTRIDANQQRVQAPGAQQRSARPAGASPEAFAEMLRAAQEKDGTLEATVSQMARLLAGGKLDPQVAVMLSLSGGLTDIDFSGLELASLNLPSSGPSLPAAKAKPSISAVSTPAGGVAHDRFNALKLHFLQAERETGVPWQIQAAQWALETGWGTATPKDAATGRESYNLFGIKGVGPAGSVESPTVEFVGGRMIRTIQQFRAYHSYEQSITEHARLLTSDYYRPAYAAGKDLKAWTEMLGPQKLGYATDPEYSRKLWQIIRENGWDQAV